MDQATHNKIVSFIWGIADDVLRDLFKRGKYPDVILPMFVLRRMDAVLEPTKKAVLETKEMLDKAGITEQRAALSSAAGQSFYNTSRFTLRDLKSRGSQQQLLADFEDYLNGFSPNVQDILENSKFRNQLSTLSKSDSLSTLIGKFLDPEINLSPDPVLNSDGTVRHPGMDNHSMGTVFEELVRKFNEENNEEAGEHWTPRDAVRLMAMLIFLPIADAIRSGSYLLYDGALGIGGMLTVGEETLLQLATARGQQITTHLYGQEINPETYAICKADMLLKGEGENADHIVGGAEWSTLSHDAFPAMSFDFMMSNPPYGKSWKKDLETMGGKDGMRDPRFKVMHQGEELSLVTRSSDGQLLFLANMASKMNHDTPLGTRGLDPTVPLKPSGIPWLGDIPKRWQVSRVKNEFRCLNTQRIPLNSVERGQMTSRLYDYYGASGVIDKVEDYLFDDELLLIAEDGANLVLRNLPLAIIARGKFWVNNHAHILKPKRGYLVYLANYLETLNYMAWISGAAQPKLTQDRLFSISIAMAPPEEQDAIVEHTTRETQPLLNAIGRLEREIELLREYRTRLVADVVTGKLDVRPAARQLPAETVEPEAAVPADDLADEVEARRAGSEGDA
jgi:type I restriction enzyme M protein